MLSNPLIVRSNNDWPKARKLIFFICLISFVFQLYRITARYYRYETEFQTKQFNGNKEVLDLPAITLCVESDAIFLKSMLRKYFPGIGPELEKIDKSNSTSKEFQKNQVYLDNLAKGMVVTKNFDRSIKASKFISCILTRPSKWMKGNDGRNIIYPCPEFSPILESEAILFGSSSQAKCFTYFSRQQSKIKGVTNLQIEMKELETFTNVISILVSMELFEDGVNLSGTSTRKSVFMFIHDPHLMPSFDTVDGINLKPGKSYDIRFWSTTKSVLKHPFHSNCYDYHKNLMSSDSWKTRDQCVHNCYVEKSVLNLNCMVPMHILFNDDKLRAYNPRHCTDPKDYYDYSPQLYRQCNEKCHQDCHQTEYKFDYKEIDYHSDGLQSLFIERKIEKLSFVHMNYRKGKDSEYKERPVHSMCATIQTMFVALLIWFGLSIFSFSSIFEMAVNKAKPHMYYINSIDDKVSPSVVSVVPTNRQSTIDWNGLERQSVHTEQPMIKPKFTPTKIGSNVKLEHYNDFISKVVEGYPTAHSVDLPPKKCFTQY